MKAVAGFDEVVGAHCGPGLLTVFCLCNGKSPE